MKVSRGRRDGSAAGTLVAVLAVAAAGFGMASPAQAASAGSAPRASISPYSSAPSGPNAASPRKCFYTWPDCTSTNPQVTFRAYSVGDTTGCEFQDTIAWGDGSPSTIQAFPGGPDGTTLARFRHTYAKPGVYTIIDTAETTAGYCGSSGDTLHFTFDGAFTVSGSDLSTLGQAGKQETGSPAGAKICGTASGQAHYEADEAIGNFLVRQEQNAGLNTASYLLASFLSGTGNPVAFSSTSPTAAEIEGSAAFTKENNDVLSYIQQQLDSGVTQVKLPTPSPLHALAFLSGNADLYLAFRYTHKINVSGTGQIVGSQYTGSLTYVISESYGFNKDNVLFGVGTAMRYLQTVCGAPYYPGGAHWFPVSVTVTVPFSLPRH